MTTGSLAASTTAPDSDYGPELDWTDPAAAVSLDPRQPFPPAASTASTDSDYGSELEWNDELESQVVAFENSASPPPVPNEKEENVAPLAVVADPGKRENVQNDEVAMAARQAEALREFGVERDERSLWERYRKRRGWGALSVSDLSGPSWCEVQHTYRLASKPFLPPLERPTSIVSSTTGASIPIDLTRTVQRETVLDKGKEVHARIEREVMGPEKKVEVEVSAKEEWWALRVLNTLVCLETLLETGRVREVHVVGWVHNFLVFGIIDEIERRDFPLHPPSPPSVTPPTTAPEPPSTSAASEPSTPSLSSRPSTPSEPKRTSKASPAKAEQDSQRTLTQFFSPVPSSAKKGKEKAASQDEVLDLTKEEEEEEEVRDVEVDVRRNTTRSGLVLSDTKTRFNRSLPPKSQSRAARLQLMLYHRLLTSLLLPEPIPSSSQPSLSFPHPFSWSRLYSHLSLEPLLPLSPLFLASILPILSSSSTLSTLLADATTLAAFVAVLAEYGELLRGERPPERLLEEEIEISYRLRDGRGGQMGWKARRETERRRKEEEDQEASKPKEEEGYEDAGRKEDEEQDLQRAVQLSLQEQQVVAVARPSTDEISDLPPVESVETDVVEEEMHVDEQLDEVLRTALSPPLLPPFPANLPPLQDDSDTPPSSSLSSTANEFALPFNSQSRTVEDDLPPPAAPRSSRPSRYYFRRRRASSNDDSQTPSAVAPTLASAPPPPIAPTLVTPEPPQADDDPSFIGIETFCNDPIELDRWLVSISAYWKGEREPVGVSIEEVPRCRACEFEEGCEWRAMKAEEAMEDSRKRRSEREAEREKRKG
ncbi:hypothetical protein JCM8547_005317 [Rhodosporidiobolus lusitaniae]